jgi:hypothetical protein
MPDHSSLPCADCVNLSAMPGIHVLAALRQGRRGWPGRSPAMTKSQSFPDSDFKQPRQSRNRVSSGLMVRDARWCRAPHHEDLADLILRRREAPSRRMKPPHWKMLQTQLRDLAARCARVVHEPFCPRKMRAWGMPGAHRTRSLACKNKISTRASSPRLQPDSPGIPARNGFNGFLRALPGDRLVCHRRLRSCLHRLDAGVEASGPHDFAVRGPVYAKGFDGLKCQSAEALAKAEHAPLVHSAPASTASRPASVTIAIRPSVGRDGANQ